MTETMGGGLEIESLKDSYLVRTLSENGWETVKWGVSRVRYENTIMGFIFRPKLNEVILTYKNTKISIVEHLDNNNRVSVIYKYMKPGETYEREWLFDYKVLEEQLRNDTLDELLK